MVFFFLLLLEMKVQKEEGPVNPTKLVCPVGKPGSILDPFVITQHPATIEVHVVFDKKVFFFFLAVILACLVLIISLLASVLFFTHKGTDY